MHSFNKKVIEHSRLVQISNDCVDGGNRVTHPEESSRERALKFAQRIPRPQPKSTTNSRDPDHCLDRDPRTVKDTLVTDEEQNRRDRLLELEAKHSYDRQQVKTIKKALGL